MAGSTTVAAAIDATGRKQGCADWLRAEIRTAGYASIRPACWVLGWAWERNTPESLPDAQVPGCVAQSLVGEVEGPPLRVDATKIAVLLLPGLFKIEHILENAPTLGRHRIPQGRWSSEEANPRKF